MDFHLRLDLTEVPGSLSLEAASDQGGERKRFVQLPFDEGGLSVLARALDLNASPRLKRWFDAHEAKQLEDWGVLVASPPEGEPITLTGDDLHRRHLRDMVRDRLRTCLIEPVRDLLDKDFAYLRAHGKDRTLHVRLEMWAEQVTLFQFPWELLHGDPSLDGEIHISRYIRYSNHVERMRPAGRLRLLVVHSGPNDLQALQLDDGERIQSGLAVARAGHCIDLQPVDTASITRLTDLLAGDRQAPTIVHFAGHGEFGRCCEHCGLLTVAADRTRCTCGRPFPSGIIPSGYLAFTRDGRGSGTMGATDWISAEELRHALSGANVQLVVLNACKTALGRRGEDVFNGIAQRLMAAVPAVVASPHPLNDQGALEFARILYEELGRGEPLVDALHHVRGRMQSAFRDEWYRPVLYLRAVQDDGGRLIDSGVLVDARSEERANKKSNRKPPPIMPPEQAIFAVDFLDQAQALVRHVKEHRGLDERGQPHPLRPRPMVFVIPGWIDRTTAWYLLERLLADLQSDLGRYDENFAALGDVPLARPWDLLLDGSETPMPATGDEPTLESRLLGTLQRQVFSGSVPAAHASDPSEYLRRFRHRQPTVLFGYASLDGARRQNFSAYVRAFRDFWSAWGEQNQLMLACLFIGYPQCAAKPLDRLRYRFLGGARRVAAFERELARLVTDWNLGVGGSVLPPVPPVREEEVRQWATRLNEDGPRLDARMHFRLLQRIDALCKTNRGPNGVHGVCFQSLWTFWNDFLDEAATGRVA